MSKALVVAAGNTEGIKLSGKYDFVIAADGGYDKALSLGLKPDVFIGDMDSVRSKVGEIEKIRLQVEKDFTDTEAAIEKAIELGFEEIDVIGATGTRFDHSFANACLLKKYVSENVKIRILDSHNEIFAINRECVVKGRKGETVSLLPLDSKVFGVTLKGFYYPLEDADVKLGTTLTVSNIITDDIAKIEIKEGVLLVIIARD